ncbi:MAG: acylase [Gemmatimonadaceae bacterium]|nr:acylase [Gemmatimonadaceae bacterium]
MTKLALLLLATASLSCSRLEAADADAARWARQARNVTITRDDWGIAHVRGRSDADAVFGMMYAQAEDDFNRIETNYLNAMGRLAEAEGASAIYRDLRMKLFVQPDSMKAQYAASPSWLKSLMVAWADGLNYYLSTHPQVKPRVITRFEPWMALTFSEGSIGGDIESISLRELEAFYGTRAMGLVRPDAQVIPKEPSGSNGFAIAPSNTATHHAMLLINPHTSFFFRSEAQVTSDEGLNVYGASTWGQFFVYQGFNDRAGWMHTSSSADAIDEYAESITKQGAGWVYRYGTEERPVTTSRIVIPFRTAAGMARKEFTVFRTHHGPVVREANGKWISVKLMQEPLRALTQSYTRTKARSLAEFRRSLELHTNSSNNTIFADAQGNIAYFHANFVPRRDPRFDWSKPVDGSNPATEWQGLHGVDESPLVINPSTGWLYNTNNWPYSAAGPDSPKRDRFPAYMDAGDENPRGVHAIRVLQARKDFTLPTLIDAAFDSWLPAFTDLIPPLLSAYDGLAPTDPRRSALADKIAALRAWDQRWSETSVPTSLAVYWGDELWHRVSAQAESEDMSVYEYMARRTTPDQRLEALAAASDRLTRDFGRWNVAWGAINRFQRLTGDIVQPFNDAKPSIPVAFTSSRWGSLASFGARTWPGTKKLYGTSGNSFVAVVEFGDSVHAKAVTAGGESGHPSSKHFDDQALRYTKGQLRDVYFYPNQLRGHIERQYHPGQ